jgi:hypothetical protein
VQYYDEVDTRAASWVGSACGGYDPPYTEDDEMSGSRTTSVVARHYVAVSKTGTITWLETATNTSNAWSASATSSGSLTKTIHWSMAVFPSCAQTAESTEWSGSNSWTIESTQTYTGDYLVAFAGVEYTQSVGVTYHSLEEYYEDDAFASGGIATKVTDQTALNEDDSSYIAECGSSGFITKTCGAQYDGGWYCTATAGVGGLTMVEPQVFRIQASAGCSGGATEYAYRLIAVNGESAAYNDPAGASARLVSYNPETGEFSIAATAADIVSWI